MKQFLRLRKLTLTTSIVAIGITMSVVDAAMPAYARRLRMPAQPANPGRIVNPAQSLVPTRSAAPNLVIPSPAQLYVNVPVGPPKESNFKWNTWTPTSMGNASVCRTHQGNVVCLTSRSSQKVGWNRWSALYSRE